jgi:chemotaxis protein CheY-P-specific phosphatase CheC
MKLSDFYNEVSKRVDTDKTAISVAETKRVLSEAFLVLAAMDAAEFADTVSKGVAQAKKKISK